MSGALASTSANFQQQGTVDWVELSGRSVQFSVAVLARLSKSGIDPFTLQVGRAICTNFSLHPLAQGRISDAVLALKKYGSYGDIIWFGFGVKHVVTDLAETEEGLTLVAICAALSTTYDSLYGARVLRELCSLCKAPQSFSPSIRQWKTLVELCAGILNSGHFNLVLDGFRRLVSGGRNAPDLETDRYPTDYSALAEAILTIARVTSRRLAGATFTGGLDCIWLGAVAEWVFSLDVVMYSSAGVTLYRSGSLDQQPPQITVVYLETKTAWDGQGFVSEKTSLISSGRTLFVCENDGRVGDRHSFKWRSSWSTILHDTFHSSVDKLLTGETAYHFGLYLYCVSMIQEPDLRYEKHDTYRFLFSSNLVDPLLWTQESSRGQNFLSFASKRLPELGACLEHDFSSISRNNVTKCGLAARHGIESRCNAHTFRSLGPRPQGSVCLMKLAEAIIVFLGITLMSEIDEEISPSVTGLSNLYSLLNSGTVSKEKQIMNLNRGQTQTALVFSVLSGLNDDYSNLEEQDLLEPSLKYLALAGGGICVYRQGLVDPNLPPDSIFKFRVVSGYISHSGANFKRIRNLSRWRNSPRFSFDASSVCRSVDAMVQETDQDSELAMTYQVNYLDGQGERKYLFMSLGRLLHILQKSVSTLNCAGVCLDLPTKSSDIAPNLIKEISLGRSTREHPVFIFGEAAKCSAQRFVANLKPSPNMWVSTSIGTNESYGIDAFSSVQMLFERPFMVYLSLMDRHREALCVFPFIPCLSCIFERGSLRRVYECLRKQMPLTGSLWLSGPGCTNIELSWETLKPDSRQEINTVTT